VKTEIFFLAARNEAQIQTPARLFIQTRKQDSNFIIYLFISNFGESIGFYYLNFVSVVSVVTVGS
jgi:hypothetical protein